MTQIWTSVLFSYPCPVCMCVCCALSHQIKRWHINFSHQPCTSLPPVTVSLSVCVDMCLVVAAATLPNWGCHRLLRPGQRERGMSNGMSPLCRLSLGSMLQFGWVRGSNRTRNVNDDHDLWVNTLSLAVVNCTGCQWHGKKTTLNFTKNILRPLITLLICTCYLCWFST